MIRAYRWDPPATAVEVPPDALARHTLADRSFVWIDLEDPTPAEEEQVFGRLLPVHPLTREDVTRLRRLPEQGAHLPKVEEFPDYLFVIVNPLPWEVCAPDRDGKPAKRSKRCGWDRPQLSAVLTESLLVTHHYQPLPSVDAVRAHVARRPVVGDRGPDFLFHLLLDEMVDEYAPVVERFADRLDRLETRLFRKPSRAVLTELLRIKRQVVFLRKTLTLEREVLARLTRGEFALVDPREIAYYRNVYDHLVRYTELVEGAREMASDLMQTHLSAASNRLNEVMKVLTMISTIGVVCATIAGIYGMNFEHMPELKWEYGYPFALGMMALAAIGAYTAFRWKGWV